MKQGLVKFSKEFITPTGLKEWVTLEWDVNVPFDEKKAMETFSKVKEFVCNYQSSYPVFQEYSSPLVPSPTIQLNTEREIGVKPEDIMSCQDLKTLETYRLIMKGNSELEEAYNLRRGVLVRKESQEILDKTNKYYESLDDNK